ncbi:hypothetical protein GCM10027277_07270 [Pseudoduganella ginsengisoli]
MTGGNSAMQRRTNTHMAAIVEHGVMLNDTMGRQLAISYMRSFDVPETVIERVLGQGRRRIVLN